MPIGQLTRNVLLKAIEQQSENDVFKTVMMNGTSMKITTSAEKTIPPDAFIFEVAAFQRSIDSKDCFSYVVEFD